MGSRIRPYRFGAIALAIVVVIVGAVLLVTKFVVDDSPIVEPVAPTAVANLRANWQTDIFLPNFLPACLAYNPNGVRIEPDPAARGGKILVIGLVASSVSTCDGARQADVVITQAPALQSLHGPVTTIMEGRMQFAHIARTATNGDNDVTLQWHCRVDIMCRVSATTGTVITEDVLAKMADSFAVTKPAS